MRNYKSLLQSHRKKNLFSALHNGNSPIKDVEVKKGQELPDAELQNAHLPSVQHILNSDTLSSIFVACAQLDWRSPVTISAVCRFWRKIVFATPRAWQYFRNLDNSLELEEDMVMLWIIRSGCLPLHMHLSRKCGTSRQENVLRFKDRLECLTVQHMFRSLDFKYPTLQYLGLFDDFWFEPHTIESTKGPPVKWTIMKAVSCLDQKRYPTLQSLTITSRTRDQTGLDLKPDFPRLQKLDLRVRGLGNWNSVLYRCSETLVSLTFEGYAEDPSSQIVSEPEVLDLPKLRHLSLNNAWVRSRPTPFIFATPFLELFETVYSVQAHGSGSFVNTNNVTHLVYHDQPDLDLVLFPAVQQVFIASTGESLDSTCSTLLGDADLCPRLSLIEYWELKRKCDQQLVQTMAIRRNIRVAPSRGLEDWKKKTLDVIPKFTVSGFHCVRRF